MEALSITTMELGLQQLNGCSIGTRESLIEPANTSPFTFPLAKTTSRTPLTGMAVMAEYHVPCASSL